MRRASFRTSFVASLVLVALAAPAFADDDEEDGGEDTVDAEDKPKPKKQAKDTEEFKKQDLRGHAVDESSAKNVFEKDRFFVDKVDSKKTSQRTLIQGSIASSTFVYTETGGTLPGAPMGQTFGSSDSDFNRLFTELRLQTDFRHIGGGKWEARIDTRLRLVLPQGPNDPAVADPTHVQSGLTGTNEYDVREAWLVRSGKRTDLFFGRQYVTDLGAVKIDGLRFDYAQSEKFTLIGFGGLYPFRGSRSLTTDYQPLKANDLTSSAGRFVGAGGFGAAYRTLSMHGAFGGVALAPLSSEAPRVYATSNGYLRTASKLDVYHFAIVDLVGSAGFALTNLSAGVNYKPSQRLRITGNFNRVDTETLNVQANAVLQPGEADTAAGGNKVQNETFIKRLSTNAARGGVSAGLGSLQRFEVSTAVTYRLRPQVTLTTPDGMNSVILAAAKGVDVYFSLTDRQSFKKLRLGADASRTFAIGRVGYQRSEVLAVRAFAARELKSGRGEWEAEIGYSTTKDATTGTLCANAVDQCFGSSTGSTLSLGGNLYYRINRDWFALGSAFLNRNTNQIVGATAPDPPIIGITGFGRIAMRF